ncbi:MAG: hypothetical protein HZC18_07165 [Candidatus Omnitrophica bacterium]|nr:hypothetical protein [Candidatus Omnitrophota bacterium]
MKKSYFLLGICLILPGLLAGCSRATPSAPRPLSEAHQKFLKICREEHKLKVVLKPLQNTLWIYVPFNDDLMKISSTAEGMRKSDTREERPAVKYLESVYSDRRFKITYDIHPDKNYLQSPGYRLGYSSAYQEISQQILTSVSRAYFEPTDAPQFFVTVIADVKNGVEMENIFYLDDLKRYMAFGALPQEEFLKRSIYEARGKSDWIGDTQGRHLAYNEMTMPEFLAKQMSTRISFKFQKSSFPPSADTRGEILNAVVETLKSYNFTDFNYVELRDLNTGLTETVSPMELTHKAEQPDTSGQ